ncbi:MAG: Arc family DNA-binding protein [Deltaproteobacteria bacterium]|nr:Arc family DNA-binding protein [Deltaproteobacteria bacterium]
MPMSLSIKNVPDEIVTRLKQRASRNHRSLQGELLSILEASVQAKSLSVAELASELEALGLKTADEATGILRELRDEGQGG